MALRETLTAIDALQSRISKEGKLSDELLKKIQYKFRLDWNYHSNAMEGNSLTREETRSVMINNITVEGKPLKDVMEVRGHDTIITDILKIGKGELRFSEKRIKDIHKGIMHEDDQEQYLKIGEWKKKENHIYNYKGEKYEFVSAADVPEEMHNLIDWFNAKCDEIYSKKKNAIHPALLAFEFHLKYVTIHPFYDGNGRTSRILMNLILIMFGFPPVIVKVGDKEIYNRYLADIQGYGGNPDLFFEFMCKLLIKSQELILTAIDGGEIDDPDDLDKKIRLLDKELSTIDPETGVQKKFSADTFFAMYDEWIEHLLNEIIPTVQKFNKFFNWNGHHLFAGNANLNFSDTASELLVHDLKSKCKNIESRMSSAGLELGIIAHYKNFIKGGVHTFDCSCSIKVKFDYLNYSVSVDEFSPADHFSRNRFIDRRLLHVPVTKNEIDAITKRFGESIYNYIDYHTKQIGIR